MRIDAIKSLRSCGVFRHFDWPTDLPSFAKFNLIYGWNGTGKSTLTRVLHCLERKVIPDGTVTISVGGNDISGTAFPKVNLSIRVFDREFVERTVRASTQSKSGSPEVPAIFVIGERNVENQKKIEDVRKLLAEKHSNHSNERRRLQTAKEAIDDFCTDQAKLIKDLLTGSGSAYSNYNRTNFKDKSESFAIEAVTSGHLLSEVERTTRIQQHQSTQRDKIPAVTYSFPDMKAIYDDLQSICSRVVTSTVIETLKSEPDVAQWVKEGLDKHAALQSAICFYCNQTIPQGRSDELNAHFNDAYQQLLNDITKRLLHVNNLAGKLKELQLPKKTEAYDHLAEEMALAVEGAQGVLSKISDSLSEVSNLLTKKQTAPFEHVELAEQPPVIDSRVIDHLNEVISRHNAHSDEFAKMVKKAREELEASSVTTALSKYRQLKDAIDQADAVLKTTESEIEALEEEKAQLEKELLEHRKPADELNRDLEHYLGHVDLQLSVLDTGYRIVRGGQPATQLSEGEQTAISLLYFLKSLSSKDFDLGDSIIVMDDPVCSLDANALFSAFGYIKERTKGAKQLFILTHNFMFFRQVKRWFHKLPNQSKKDMNLRPARFYMLRCLIENTQRQSEICWLDHLLEEYESDYHYTFFLIHKLANQPAQGLENYFVAPNLARKLMETFLAFHAPGPGGESNFAKLEDIVYDENKKTRVLRFLSASSQNQPAVSTSK